MFTLMTHGFYRNGKNYSNFYRYGFYRKNEKNRNPHERVMLEGLI
jgi:hypothetical protein